MWTEISTSDGISGSKNSDRDCGYRFSAPLRFGDMISVDNKTLDVFKSDDHLKNHSVEPVFFDSALPPQEG